MATTVPQSKFQQARIGLGQLFELKAREGLNDGTSKSRKQLLDEIEAEALRLYKVNENPIWHGLALCHRAGEDGGEAWVERIETEERVPWDVWSEKCDYDANLGGLLQQLCARKRYWMGRYDREGPDPAEAEALPVTDPVASPGKRANDQHANATDLSTEDHMRPIYGGVQEKSTSGGRRYGFQADMQRHVAIAEIVTKHAKHWEGGSALWARDLVLQKICIDLDQAEIDIPLNWKNGKPAPKGKKQLGTRHLRQHNAAGRTASADTVKLKSWSDALALGYKRSVVDQIRYSLRLVIKHRFPAPAET
jgi:hypothetical protein